MLPQLCNQVKSQHASKINSASTFFFAKKGFPPKKDRQYSQNESLASFSLWPLRIPDATKACRASGLLQFMPRFFFVLSLIHWFCLLLVLLHLQVLQPNKIMRWEKDIPCRQGALISFWSDTSQIGHQLLCYLRLIHQSIYFDFITGSCLLLQKS